MHLTKLFRGWHTLLLCLPLASISQDIQWEKSYGGKHADYLFDVIPTADYGFILAGSSMSGKTGNKNSVSQGNLDYWIWKMDEKGEPVWQKSLGGDDMDMLKSILATRDGGFILAGTSLSTKSQEKREDSFGQGDFWIVKLDAKGGEQWQKTFGGTSADDVTTIQQTPDGGYIVGGTSSSDNSGNKAEKSRGSSDYWIVKLSPTGEVQWQKTYGGKFQDQLRNIVVTQNGFLVVGYSNSPESGDKIAKNYGAGDFWIINVDIKGNILWQNTLGGNLDDQPASLITTKDGNFLLAGYSNSGTSGNKTASNSLGSDWWLIKIDNTGTVLWQETYNFGKYDILTSILENPDETIVIGGYAKTETMGKSKEELGINDYVALKINANGEEIWRRDFGSDGEDILKKLIPTRDGGYLFAGTSNASSQNYSYNRNIKQKNLQIDSNKSLYDAQSVQDEIDNTIQEGRDSINNTYKEKAGELTETINSNLNSNDNPFKIGMNQPSNLLSQGNSGKSMGIDSNSLTGSENNYKKQPASREKTLNYGLQDFWIVKIKDKDKKEKVRNAVEAIPNPAFEYTNIIIGYEFEKGTATVYDISGRQIEHFQIKDRTVPINLSKQPEGVYIVQIQTNKSTDSVKILKAKN